MAANTLHDVVLFLYNLQKNKNRAHTVTKAIARDTLSESQLLLLPVIVTAKERLGYRAGSKVAKAHIEAMSSTKNVPDINTPERLEAAIQDMTLYRAVNGFVYRQFLYSLLFNDVVLYIGPAWIRDVCANGWEYLHPQILSHVNLEIHDWMRPQHVVDDSELNERYRVVEVKMNGHGMMLAVYENNAICWISRGGEMKWASSTVLYDRNICSAIDPPDNPGALRFLFHGEIIACQNGVRLPAHQAVNVGSKKPGGIFVVWDLLYCPKWKSHGKAYRNDEYVYLSQKPLKLRKELLTLVVEHYNPEIYYSDDAAMVSDKFLWLVPTVHSDEEIAHALQHEEGVVIKYLMSAYYGICGTSDRNQVPLARKSWFKWKQRDMTIDVEIRGGKCGPKNASLPASLDMWVMKGDDDMVSLEHRVAGISGEDIEYLDSVGYSWNTDGSFTMKRPIYAEVVIDMQDGIMRHPRLVRFRELSEGFTITKWEEVYV